MDTVQYSRSAETEQTLPSDENPVVLIAEDDPINTFLLESMLHRSNAKVSHVENGVMAVDFCKNNPDVSLVLMDIKMPVMDGFEATRLIKSFRKNLPVIAVTAYAMPGHKELALGAGCDDYMSKPFTSSMLMNLVRSYIAI